MKKTCKSCGYRTEEKDLRCPICGGALYYDLGREKACDTVREKEWNSGFHNDFEEGRKTGEYCDPKLEKYANGGEHYHGTVKTTFSDKSTEIVGPRFTPKGALIATLIVSLIFPVVGPIIVLGYVKNNNSEAAVAARRASIVLMILSLIAVFSFLQLGII